VQQLQQLIQQSKQIRLPGGVSYSSLYSELSKNNTVMKRMSWVSRVLVVFAAVAIVAANYYPVWRIELDAPQYPEGLALTIWADRLDGDVDVINGLNHYIGMATLHAEEFVEFTVLPYILWAIGAIGIVVAIANRKKLLYAYLSLFMVFAITAMVDFYVWEYKYGHNLSPDAPIQVPGMAYQPPLIGFKQLLNFGAYSIPDTGGWALVAAGVLLCAGVAIELIKAKRTKMKKIENPAILRSAAAMLVLLLMVSCKTGPTPINFGKDVCDHCKMIIMDNKYCSEIVTNKGKVFKFDDYTCMSAFSRTDQIKNAGGHNTYISDYNGSGFVKSDSAFFITSSSLRGPMGGTFCGFKDKASQEAAITNLKGTAVTFAEVTK
jgi:copper chaperone NosL